MEIPCINLCSQLFHQSLFTLLHYLQPLEKKYGENFWCIFLFFLKFLKNECCKSTILDSIDKTDCEKSLYVIGYAQNFQTKFKALGKKTNIGFLNICQSFPFFLENCPPKSDILGSMAKKC